MPSILLSLFFPFLKVLNPPPQLRHPQRQADARGQIDPLRGLCPARQKDKVDLAKKHLPVKISTKRCIKTAQIEKSLYQHKAEHVVHHDGIGISSNPDHFTRDIRNSAHNPGYPKPKSNSRDYRQIGDNRSVGKTADPHGAEIQPCTEYDNQHLHAHDAGKVKAVPKGIIFFQLFPVKPS